MSRHMEYAFALLCVSILVTSPLRAQELIWSNNYGGLYHEFGNACSQTEGGDLLMLGSTYSYGNGSFDIYLVKVDSLGNQIFGRTFGGEGTEYGYDITPTSDGGFVIVGSTKSFGNGGRDVYLIKVDAFGDMLWSRTFGGTADDEGRSVRETSDGGFIICGGTYSWGAGYQDVLIIRTDALGNQVWLKTYGGAGGEAGAAVRPTGDGYIVIGSTGSFGEGYSSMYVVKTDANGDSLWATTYGGARADYGYSVLTTRDGGLALVGATTSYGAGSNDAYLIKTDPDGNIEWERTYGGGDDDRACAVIETGSGDFILAGRTLSYSGNHDVYVVKADPAGYQLWSRDYGGAEADYGENLIMADDNNYLLIGRSFSYSSGGSDIYLLKLQGDQTTGVGQLISQTLPSHFELAQNYPNPFNSSTTIHYSLTRRATVSVEIYNILGQRVREWEAESMPPGTYRLHWDGTGERGDEVGSGMYIYVMRADELVQSRKMVLLK
ncbi:MAG: T9SS type A sorting domain-containing protein [Candidatus Zixiibacteriota bacterium]|nr:MAG: T9SS type A sorting domain-containing protein [candidate division Zixibacteria bacterium]